MITLHYSSNNSGGSRWLKDEDWKALEAAGWQVETLAARASKEKAHLEDGNEIRND